MKKILKFNLLVAFLILSIIVLTSCGKEKKEENKTAKFYETIINNDEYLLKIQSEIETDEGAKEEGIITIAQKGDNNFTSTDSESTKASILNKDNSTYLLLDSEKIYVITERNREEEQNNLFFEKDELDRIKKATYNKGKEIIENNEYEYEEFDAEDGEKIKYYFEGDLLKYIKDDETLIKILEAKNTADDSFFEIPADYTEANY